MAMDSLIKFSSEVIKTAESHREELLLKVRQEETERYEAAKAEIKSKKISRIRVECAKLKLEADKEVSVLKNDLKREIFTRREEMFQDVFSQVTQKVMEYKNSSLYLADMVKAIKLALTKIGQGEIECFAAAEDIDAFKKEIPTLVYKESDADIIGGFLLKNKEKGLYLDMTLKSKIEEQKKKFYRKSGLVLG